MAANNPIKTVDSAEIPSPSTFQWEREDISDSSAGRTEDGLMHKNRVGYKVAVALSWNNVSTEVASQILKAFAPEYVSVKYLDPEVGDYTTRKFYVGNRTAPMYNCKLGLWSNISFKIIQQ